MQKNEAETNLTSGSPIKDKQYINAIQSIQKKNKRKHEEFQCNSSNNYEIVQETPPQSLSSEPQLKNEIVNPTGHEPQQKKKKKKKKALEDSITDDVQFAGASVSNKSLVPSTSELNQIKQPNIHKLLDTDEEELDLDERQERAGSITSNIIPAVSVMPKEMYCFCKYILDLEEQKSLNLTGKKGNVKFNALLRDITLDSSFDLAQLQACFVQFYRWSTLLTEVPLTEALKKVMEFVQSEHILQRFPEFPKTKSLWSIYLTKCGVDSSKIFVKNNNLRENFKNKQDKAVIEAEEEFKQSKRDLISSCKEFLDKYKDSLFQTQIVSIQKKLGRLEREISLENQTKGKTERKQKKSKPTAFDLFKKTKEGKYSDLSEEDRERKLIRQYGKLDPAQKNIYESIAESL
ncbi:hypothetical protein Mgra_00007401 [Meloidogyne graminicola]|uniref:Uncharacterized protein n=1 Tax=Meloidogyne graminicola TaxID=189291 RepID=A0A8S9ZIW2_9BILA|nr:hypothetical protein Mgra_00007401 [Meloidogyne graminicola]